MNKQVDKWIDEHMSQLIEDLSCCLRIPSVRGEALPGMPFGEGPAKALECALSKAEKNGFSPVNMDNYCGYFDYGEGDSTFAILNHLDVVPAGMGWTVDPFGAEIHDDKLYARGVMDNKGPAFMAMYALMAVRECGIPLSKKVRLIWGCNEESGMAGVQHYLDVNGAPDIAISPDGKYPVVNAEKSGFRQVIAKSYDSTISLEAGEVANVVPGLAVAVVPLELAEVRKIAEKHVLPEGFSLELESCEKGTCIRMHGVISHASMPWLGHNALQAMIMLLAKLPLAEEDSFTLNKMARYFAMDYYGENLGIDFTDESGRQTVNLGIMKWDEKGFELTFDLRCPNSADPEHIRSCFAKAAEDMRAEHRPGNYSKGFTIPADSELVGGLLKIFAERTGIKDPKPLAMGGGTYARKLPYAVSFGIEEYKCCCVAHDADECLTMEQLEFNTKMLADAIIELAGK